MLNRLNRTVKKYGWLLVLVFAAGFIIYRIASSEEKESQRQAIHQFAQADTLSETGTGIEILYTQMGEPKARIIAPELTRILNQEGITEFKKGMKIFFYGTQGHIESSMSANYGKAFEQKEEVLARDNVVIINLKGEKLETEELLWKRKEKKIYSDKFVKITTADQIIVGNGLEADEDFTNYLIKEVKGTIKLDAGRFKENN